VYDLNFLTLGDGEGDGVGAVELHAEAERAHRAAGLAHARIDVADEARGAALVDGLAALGLTVERHVFMALRRAPDRAARTDVVREVDRATVLAAIEENLRSNPWATDEVVGQLLSELSLLERPAQTRYFAAFAGDDPVSYAKLYGNGRSGQVEDVATLEPHRGQGFARACVAAAMEASRAAGHDFTFIVADVADWPKELYARMGFDEVGVKHRFLRRAPTVAGESHA
jgi:GNAT superfamily N-acetyltransferase